MCVCVCVCVCESVTLLSSCRVRARALRLFKLEEGSVKEFSMPHERFPGCDSLFCAEPVFLRWHRNEWLESQNAPFLNSGCFPEFRIESLFSGFRIQSQNAYPFFL